MPASSAASFTGELAVFLPRPRGRSGCVTTAALPLARFFHLADFALDHVPLEHAEMHDEKSPVQVIDLVAERASEQSFATHFKFGAGRVLRAHRDVLWPRHMASESGKRETAFLFALFALGVNDFRIGTDELRFGIFPIRDIN